MRSTVFAATVGSVVALVGFAGAANASATVDLIWVDVTNTDSNGNPICLQPAQRNCPQLGTTLSSVAVAVTDNITLGVIVTAGPQGLLGAGVTVNYGDALPKLRVVDFGSLATPVFLPTQFGFTYNEPIGWVQNIIAVAVPFNNQGIGLPAGATAYLGTVTFHTDALINGTFEIGVGVDGPGHPNPPPGPTDDVLDLDGNNISGTTTFNSAFLGNVFPTPTPTPTPPPPPGSVVGWGDEHYGQASPPDTVNGVSGTATDIAAGGNHSCAIQAGTGNVVCWGSNFYGKATPPDAVNGVSGTAADITAAAGHHSCAIQAGTGNAVCWGWNYRGQSAPPDTVNGISGTATDVAAGYEHNCAIQAGTGDVVCWGFDFYGQATPPNGVAGVSGTATDIAAGKEHSCAIQAGTGNVVCWGRDSFGQATPPDAVNGVAGAATDVEAGWRHSCAIQAGTGHVVCWGSDGADQASPPDAVNGVSGTATDITLGRHHSCAIQAGTGNAVCWGADQFGQSAPPDTVNGISGTASDIAGDDHTLAIVPEPSALPALGSGIAMLVFLYRRRASG